MAQQKTTIMIGIGIGGDNTAIPPVATFDLVQQDGSSLFLLQDGVSNIILQTSP